MNCSHSYYLGSVHLGYTSLYVKYRLICGLMGAGYVAFYEIVVTATRRGARLNRLLNKQ